MNRIAPCDPNELKEAIKYCCTKSNSPVYLRIGKSGEKNYSNNLTEKWEFGKIRKISKGKDICFLTFGPIIKKAFEIKEKFEKENISSEIYSCHTLKPFDYPGLRKIFKKFKKIIVIEDHSKIGGLSEIVKSFAYECKYFHNILSYSLKDKFIHSYGTQEDLQEKHGISTKKILKQIKKIKI